ncbi:hypothetical protein TWF694_002908, partial [Orbilia ellipsospora]
MGLRSDAVHNIQYHSRCDETNPARMCRNIVTTRALWESVRFDGLSAFYRKVYAASSAVTIYELYLYLNSITLTLRTYAA